MNVLITGCSTGIGRATATRLAAGDWTVVATARRVETLAGLDRCQTLALDVTDEASMVAAVDGPRGRRADQQRGLLAVGRVGDAVDGVRAAPVRDQRLRCVAHVPARAAGDARDAAPGKIVNVSSMGGRLTFPGGGAYHATKYAVEAMSDALRMEVAPVRDRRHLHRAGPDPHRVRRRRPRAACPTTAARTRS